MQNVMRNQIIQEHYQRIWKIRGEFFQFRDGPWKELPPGFGVLRFSPGGKRRVWTYATCGMSAQADANPIELHMFSPSEEADIIALLTIVAHYHLTGVYLDVGHTINFGKSWLPNSFCNHGLISLPYLDGPELEWCTLADKKIRCLWLIPITAAETAFARAHGLEALEQRFERSSFNYLDPARLSVV
jgi:Suppressor of fused protein (SUFU)